MTARWQLKIKMPFGVWAVSCDDYAIIETRYLSATAAPLPPQNALATELARQVRAYLRRPRGAVFDLPLVSAPTAFQRRVRAALQTIGGGQIRTYGAIAKQIGSAPRAVGGACRANRLPLLIPCHRVVAADGLGGFMGVRGGHQAAVKRWLLGHEGAAI